MASAAKRQTMLFFEKSKSQSSGIFILISNHVLSLTLPNFFMLGLHITACSPVYYIISSKVQVGFSDGDKSTQNHFLRSRLKRKSVCSKCTAGELEYVGRFH